MSEVMDRFDKIVKREKPENETPLENIQRQKEFWNAAIDVFNEDVLLGKGARPIEKI